MTYQPIAQAYMRECMGIEWRATSYYKTPASVDAANFDGIMWYPTLPRVASGEVNRYISQCTGKWTVRDAVSGQSLVEDEEIAGPFETFEAACAAYVMLGYADKDVELR
jgi:hypothetical protein